MIELPSIVPLLNLSQDAVSSFIRRVVELHLKTHSNISLFPAVASHPPQAEESDKEDEKVEDVKENGEAGEGEEGEEKKPEGEEEEEKDFEVEKIMNRKKSKGQWLYLVRWAGFDESEDTWEPIENLAGIWGSVYVHRDNDNDDVDDDDDVDGDENEDDDIVDK